MTEQACNMYSMVSVPLYDTLGDNAGQCIINQSKYQYMFFTIVFFVYVNFVVLFQRR